MDEEDLEVELTTKRNNKLIILGVHPIFNSPKFGLSVVKSSVTTAPLS